MSDYYFHADRLCVGYDGKPLIRDITIELNRGQIITLIGPNGAGKSTILKSIARQLSLLGGTIYLDDRNMQQMSGNEIARLQAVVLTERTTPELMTCQEVVAAGRYPYTGRLGILGAEDRRKVHEAMALVHAQDLETRDFRSVSDGQRQRLLLARAICQEPELIILDEPTSFLDIRHKLEFLTILRDMARSRKVAVIMSLHELDLAQKISDLVLCVNGPVIDRCGPPEEIFRENYIRDLFGMTDGSYDPLSGCMELPAVQGKPEVFVISGAGTGIPVYRKLQRLGIPFATGILQRQDIDYEAARHLAARVISVKEYEDLTDEAVREAETVMDSCSSVICTLTQFGRQNQKNYQLYMYAKDRGILGSLEKMENHRGQ